MASRTRCPLCSKNFETEPDLRVHLEVEHRKSELAAYAVASAGRTREPQVEPDRPTPPA